MHVRFINQQPHALATMGRQGAVDPGDYLLSADQLVLGDARQGAVDERIGSQLLHDADIDRDALATLLGLGCLRVGKLQGRIPSTRVFSSDALARVSRGT